MLVIRAAQMEALRQATRRRYLLQLAHSLRKQWPDLFRSDDQAALSDLEKRLRTAADHGISAQNLVEPYLVAAIRIEGLGESAKARATAILSDPALSPDEKLFELQLLAASRDG